MIFIRIVHVFVFMTTHVHHNRPYGCYELVFFMKHIVRGELFWIFHVRICMAFYAQCPWVFGVTIFGQYQIYFAAIHITERERGRVGRCRFYSLKFVFFSSTFSHLFTFIHCLHGQLVSCAKLKLKITTYSQINEHKPIFVFVCTVCYDHVHNISSSNSSPTNFRST